MAAPMNGKTGLAALAIIVAGGCSDGRDESATKVPGVEAFTICGDEREPCDPRLGIANRNGVSVLVHPAREDWDLDPIGERPMLAPPLEGVALVQALPASAGNCCDAPNWYPLGRLQMAKRGAPFLTTSNGWPIVVCATTFRDVMGCTAGIEERGRFVEILVSPRSRTVPTQREIWDLASAVEEEVSKRGLTRPASNAVRPSLPSSDLERSHRG